MAKEDKDNVTPKGEDVAEAAPVAISVAVSRVLSESDAKEFVKISGLQNYSGELIVTEDLNIFLSDNKKEALKHASKQKLKYFTITWP
jgi:hypothetical protein